MKTTHVLAILLFVGIVSNLSAAPNPKPPPPPQDVTVVNDATNPVPVTVQNQNTGCSLSQFVGFTTDTFDGGQGVATYTNACQLQYPGSHMCSSLEYLNSEIYPAETGKAWIKPSTVPTSVATGVSKTLIYVQDASGLIFENDISTSGGFLGISCAGWSVTNDSSKNVVGLHISGTGQFGSSTCNAPLSIACCGATQ